MAAWLVGLGILAGGMFGGWQWLSHSDSPWPVKWRIHRHLKKHARLSDFRTDFPLPSKKDMSRAPAEAGARPELPPAKGRRTQKTFDALKSEYIAIEKEILALRRGQAAKQKEIENLQDRLTRQEAAAQAATNTTPARPQLPALRQRLENAQKELAGQTRNLAGREEALAPLLSDLQDFQRAWTAERPAMNIGQLTAAHAEFARRTRENLEVAATYERVYKLIGQQLWVVDHLIGSANPQHRRLALRLVRQAARDALTYAEDDWLASHICQACVWPNLNLPPARGEPSPPELLEECADIFRRADDRNGLIRNYELLLARAENPRQADGARVRLSLAHEQAGDFAQALRYLKEVKSTNDFAWAMRRMPRLQQQAKR